MADKDALDNEDIYFTPDYEILRRIFSFLPLADIRTCLEIGDDWKSAALVTIKNRRSIQAFLLDADVEESSPQSDATLTLHFSNASEVNREDKCIMSQETINIYAFYGIIFVHNTIRHHIRRHSLKPLRKNAAILRFPPHDEVTIKTIKIGSDLLSEEAMESLIDLPSGVPIQAIMVIAYNHDEGVDNVLLNIRTIKKCAEKRQPSCALGGCWLDPKCNVLSNVSLKVTLFAGTNIEAGSCVLDNYCRTLDSINGKVEEFSKNVTRVKDSVLLSFRCYSRLKVRRRYNYQPTENVETWESSAVSKFFPSVPMVGCYGTGELGINSPENAEPKKKRLTTSDVIEHQFSSILLYIGFKK